MGGIITKGKPAKAEAKKPAPNLRDRLSEAFLKALEGDFAVHGLDVVVQLRQQEPGKYCELAAKLVAQAVQPPDPTQFAGCHTELDIARKLLLQVGMHEEAITDSALQLAAEANAQLVTRLLVIAEGN